MEEEVKLLHNYESVYSFHQFRLALFIYNPLYPISKIEILACL